MSLDADLIRALQEDGRASIQSLADSLGHTRARVAARLQEMIQAGAVRVVAALDPAFLGQSVIAHVSVRTDGAAEPVIEALTALDESVLVSAVAGVPDIVTELRLASIPALNNLIADIRRMPHLADLTVHLYTDVLKGFFMSHYRGEVTLDDIDLELIDLLQRDGRMSYRALGEAVRLSPSAVTTRVTRLVTAGVIKISAVEARGLAQRQLSMGVGITLASDDAEVVSWLAERRGVDFAARTLGRFDLIATLVEPSTTGLFDSLEHLRSLDSVRHVEAWSHLAVRKEDYARTLRPARAPSQ